MVKERQIKPYVKNVILVMSGGRGARFGADCPKQYCYMNKRMVIDYVIDACRNSKLADEIVIVASEEYVDFICERYGFPVIAGGNSRPDSVAQGLRYVHENYDCQKLIITNAVCPLATCEQYDRYFRFLDEYDYVLTTWNLAPALQRYDGTRVDRDDYFNVMEPDAYRFPLLYENFDFNTLKKYIFHNMPLNSKAYYCFDYPYTMKLTYHHDLEPLRVLYEDIVARPQWEETMQTVNLYLSADGRQGVEQWIMSTQRYMREMAQKYSVTSYSVNAQTEANIVYEAISERWGGLIFKFTPSAFHFNKEYVYYKYADPGIMARMVGYDKEYNALVLEKIKPGLQVKFSMENGDLRDFFERVEATLIPLSAIAPEDRQDLPTVVDEFNEYVQAADHFTFEYAFRKKLEQKAYRIWDCYFADAPNFYLHRDLHRRNILTSKQGYRAIDPRGAIGPKEFEFVIQFIIELREDQAHTLERYRDMFAYFTKYCDPERLSAALFIFWVYKMNDYTFQKHDKYKLAKWCMESMISLFFADKRAAMDPQTPPAGLTFGTEPPSCAQAVDKR